VPSLPGYGWSDKPTTPGWDVPRIARAWATLMGRLGYDRYGAQGGDWGAMVTTSLAQQRSERVVGIHVNMPVVRYDQVPKDDITASEQAALADLREYRKRGMGYSAHQSTRPQTLGYGLTDSPAGQCAWIVEKFREWTDCDGHPENALSRDQILDNISVYWFTGTAASSIAPARGGGPSNTYSWSPCKVRACSKPTTTRAPSGAQRDAVVRNVGGVIAPGPNYSGASDCIAIANSRIFPRSAGYSYGVPTEPTGSLTVPPRLDFPDGRRPARRPGRTASQV